MPPADTALTVPRCTSVPDGMSTLVASSTRRMSRQRDVVGAHAVEVELHADLARPPAMDERHRHALDAAQVLERVVAMARSFRSSISLDDSEMVRIGTSSTSTGLISGWAVPGGMRSMFDMMRS